MRSLKISPGEHYHIYNRGMGKQTIFHDKGDRLRFIFLILYCQSRIKFQNIYRLVREFSKTLKCSADSEEIAKNRNVELVAFCLMPNHFHLLLKETEEGGVGQYMQRVLNAYTKYFNTKYEKSGHLFQGPYKAVHITDDQQLLYLSAYIHKNSPDWETYVWSSYQDFVEKNRWGNLLTTGVIIDRYENKDEYKSFVQTSTAKEPLDELNVLHSVLNKSL